MFWFASVGWRGVGQCWLQALLSPPHLPASVIPSRSQVGSLDRVQPKPLGSASDTLGPFLLLLSKTPGKGQTEVGWVGEVPWTQTPACAL